jgi:hypothetical protein
MDAVFENLRILLVLGLLVLIIYLLSRDIYRRRSRRKTVEAGQLHNRKKALKSPLPDRKYDIWRGEKLLIDPQQMELDLQLAELCDRFMHSDAAARTVMRQSLSWEDIDTLQTFAARAAVFAMRHKDVDWVRRGLAALAMTEYDSIDVRDVYIPVGLLHHSAVRIGENAAQVFQEIAGMADPGVSKFLLKYIDNAPGEFPYRSSLHTEVETQHGVGFIGWDFKDYQPTCALDQITIEIGNLIASDQYQPSVIQLATELAPTWLDNDRAAKKLLQNVRACSLIWSNLRPRPGYQLWNHSLLVFVVEAADEATAKSLLEISKGRKKSGQCQAGLSSANMFCLVIQWSHEKRAQPLESSESLGRFTTGIAGILSHSLA